METKTKAERKKLWKEAFEDSADRGLDDTKKLELTKEEWEEKNRKGLSGEARKLSLEELQRLCGLRK